MEMANKYCRRITFEAVLRGRLGATDNTAPLPLPPGSGGPDQGLQPVLASPWSLRDSLRMGQDQPLRILVMIAATVVVARWWIGDFRLAAAGSPSARALPGASPAPLLAVLLAAAGALLMLGAEAAGEYHLGLVEQQSHTTALFGLYTLTASFVEELIFRGFVVVDNRGRTALGLSIVAASVIFALLHPFLWEWREGALHLQINGKAWFSTGSIFVGSLWFYAVRFWPLNPGRSLLPCIAAHAAKNLGVFAIKYAQGFVDGWW